VASVAGPTGSPTVNRVLGGELCTGCGLCAAACLGAVVAPWTDRLERSRCLLPARRCATAFAIGTEVRPYSQARRKRLVASRLLACVLTGQPRPRMAGLDLARAARRAGPVESARNTLGTVRRILQGRR